jgi:pentatricopeptide repeat protein
MESEGGSEEWDPRLIGSVLNGLALWGRAEEAQSLLEKAMGLKIASTGSDDSTLTPSPRRLIPSEAEPCYNALLRAWSKVAIMASSKQVDSTSLTESRNALSRGNSILLHHIPAVPGLTISNRTCLAALQGYGALGLGDEAEQLLSKIETMLAATDTSVMVSHLDSACYNSVLDAHSQSKQSAGMPRAKQLFDSMVKQQAITISNNDTTIEVLPPQADYISYNTMLNSYSKRGMADEAETLLKEMALASSTDSKAPLPTAASYLSVVRALERSNTENASERIMSLIENMRQLYENDNASKGNRKHPMPNRGIYISAIRFMSKCGKAIEAEQLYQNLRQTHPYSKSWTDIQACTLVLKAWGWTDQVTREEAAKRAANVLRDLESHVEEGHLKPLDVNVYNTMLNCYAKAGLVEETKALLKRMQPNGISYGLFIKAISKNNKSNAVDMAWKVLESLGYNSPKLSPIFDDSMEPFNSMLRLLAKRGLAADAESLLNTMDELYYDRKLNFRPNIQSYEAVLEALGRCKDSDTAIRAEAILTRMDVLQELGGTIQPSLMAYNHLINCYGNAGMSSRAERLLEQLQKNAVDSVTPDEYTIGSTIKAIINGGKSQENALTRVSTLVEGSRDGVDNKVIGAHQLKLYAKFGMGDEADELLRSMKRPGIIHYTIVLDSWAKNDSSDALERAEALFAEMEKHPDFTLDIAAYNSLLLNYSIRGLVDKAEKLVERIMLDPFLINRKTFTMLINAYNNAPMKHANAARRAEQLLDKMRELHALGNNEAEPDDVTYRSIIKCIRSGNVDAADHEKLALISRLQLEKWPFDR